MRRIPFPAILVIIIAPIVFLGCVKFRRTTPTTTTVAPEEEDFSFDDCIARQHPVGAIAGRPGDDLLKRLKAAKGGKF
jgi:hypothetical protein